ncbi:MAG: diguanylate cyclase [Methylophaga sp.]|nr:diguanylate cyclase [Methylophaga sp.]
MQMKCAGHQRVVFVITLIMLILPCLNPAVVNAETGKDLQPVQVQLKWKHQFQFAGYYAAIDQGYYRDAGLDVQLKELTPNISPIDPLIAGRIEFAVADTGALIYRSNGVPVVALANIFQKSPSILLALTSSGIHELEDIRGKRIMLSGGYLNAELMAMLSTAEIYNDDLQPIGINPDISILVQGETDTYNGYTTNEPYFLQQQNIPFITFAPSDYGIDFYGDTLITTEAIIDKDPQMVDDFVKATLKGWEYAVNHPEAVVDLILRDYNSQQKTRDHLLFEAYESIKMILPNLVPIGYMHEKRWQHIQQIFIEQGHIIRPVDFDNFLYQSKEQASLHAFIVAYKKELLFGVLLLIGLLLVGHIASLRAQIKSRTRELQAAKQLAEIEARTDALTGLPNRRHFLESLGRDTANAERHQWPLTVISMDIDFFKTINDQYGHAAGDETLRQISQTFKHYSRASDAVARIGGEEFALICLNSSAAETEQLAERLRTEIANTVITYQAQQFNITLSLGIAIMQPGDDVDQLLRKADLALYEAKQTGRNKVCIWSSSKPLTSAPQGIISQ